MTRPHCGLPSPSPLYSHLFYSLREAAASLTYELYSLTPAEIALIEHDSIQPIPGNHTLNEET